MQFSSDPLVSLEKSVESDENIIETATDKIEDVYEIKRCVNWVNDNKFERVCLQFPDFLLPDSSDVALRLQKILAKPVYILGDTAYGSCCIDYVTAAHIDSDAIIHFGNVCFSEPSQLVPHLNIYEKCSLNLENSFALFESSGLRNDKTKTLILLDTPYAYKKDEFDKYFSKFDNVVVAKLNDEDNLKEINEFKVIFVTNNDKKCTNFYLVFHPKEMLVFKPDAIDQNLTPFIPNVAIFKRRNFLIEKIKDSQTIGLVIASLSVKNCLKIIERLTNLIKIRGRKYYLISVGKPTIPKLANFPEVDIYVAIACTMNEIQDSREFFKPIVTPWDVEMALNPTIDKNLPFSYDYNSYLESCVDPKLPDSFSDENDVSLISGNIRATSHLNKDKNCSVAIRNDGTVAQQSTNLANRTWRGLEQNLGQNEASEIEKGRSGIASGYNDEGQG